MHNQWGYLFAIMIFTGVTLGLWNSGFPIEQSPRHVALTAQTADKLESPPSEMIVDSESIAEDGDPVSVKLLTDGEWQLFLAEFKDQAIFANAAQMQEARERIEHLQQLVTEYIEVLIQLADSLPNEVATTYSRQHLVNFNQEISIAVENWKFCTDAYFELLKSVQTVLETNTDDQLRESHRDVLNALAEATDTAMKKSLEFGEDLHLVLLAVFEKAQSESKTLERQQEIAEYQNRLPELQPQQKRDDAQRQRSQHIRSFIDKVRLEVKLAWIDIDYYRSRVNSLENVSGFKVTGQINAVKNLTNRNVEVCNTLTMYANAVIRPDHLTPERVDFYLSKCQRLLDELEQNKDRLKRAEESLDLKEKPRKKYNTY